MREETIMKQIAKWIIEQPYYSANQGFCIPGGKTGVERHTSILCLALEADNFDAICHYIREGANPNFKEKWYCKRQENGHPKKVLTKIKLPIDYVKDMWTANLLIKHGAKVSQEQLDRIEEIEGKRKKSRAKSGGLKKMLTLASKEKALDKASEKQRKEREEEVAKAEKAGKPLSKEEVKKLRDAEGRARARAYKGMLEERFGQSSK